MSEIPVFVIANFKIDEPTIYRAYEKGFFPILKKHGGKFLTFDDKSEKLEGINGLAGRTVLFMFPSKAAAKAWYADPEYQALSEHRRKGTTMNFLSLIHGQPTQG